MSDILLHVFKHTVYDSFKMLPFLFLAYFLIEYIEYRKSHSIEKILAHTGKFGFAAGSFLGCIPQCGFSVLASNFYAGRIITAGTLVAVFVSTSDEAIPVLLSNPDSAGMVLKLIVIKILVAVIAGFLTDLFLSRQLNHNKTPLSEQIHEDICTDCNCEKHGILYGAFSHTISIYVFIFLISFILNIAIELIGHERLASLLLSGSVLQPVIAAIIGLIPNCASSVLLTELLINGAISFGSAVSGLCAGAGVGILVLFKVNKHTKENVYIVLIVALTGIITGLILQTLGI
ncbi:MAG: arsenic efflux protein [Clostridia bacterium]|nr:arsenic efflux protein [Clostridia bacterium]